MNGGQVLISRSWAVAGGLLVVAILLGAGCGVVEEKRQAYRASESIAPLQLPGSLSSPVGEDALMLPELQIGAAGTAAEPFDTRPPAASNLPPESVSGAKE